MYSQKFVSDRDLLLFSIASISSLACFSFIASPPCPIHTLRLPGE